MVVPPGLTHRTDVRAYQTSSLTVRSPHWQDIQPPFCHHLPLNYHKNKMVMIYRVEIAEWLFLYLFQLIKKHTILPPSCHELVILNITCTVWINIKRSFVVVHWTTVWLARLCFSRIELILVALWTKFKTHSIYNNAIGVDLSQFKPKWITTVWSTLQCIIKDSSTSP